MTDRQDWAERHCVPCEGGVAPLGRAEAEAALAGFEGWRLDAEARAITRRFEVKGFARAMQLANVAGWLGEREGHQEAQPEGGPSPPTEPSFGEHKEDWPVVEVDAVADAAEVSEWPPRQQRDQHRGPEQGRVDHGGGEHGVEQESTPVHPRLRQRRHRHHRDQTSETGESAQQERAVGRCRVPAEPAVAGRHRRGCERHADEELRGAGVRAVVDGVVVGPGLEPDDAEDGRPDREGAQDRDGHRPCGAPAAQGPVEREDQQRRHDVELGLHGEARPPATGTSPTSPLTEYALPDDEPPRSRANMTGSTYLVSAWIVATSASLT